MFPNGGLLGALKCDSLKTVQLDTEMAGHMRYPKRDFKFIDPPSYSSSLELVVSSRNIRRNRPSPITFAKASRVLLPPCRTTNSLFTGNLIWALPLLSSPCVSLPGLQRYSVRPFRQTSGDPISVAGTCIPHSMLRSARHSLAGYHFINKVLRCRIYAIK